MPFLPETFNRSKKRSSGHHRGRWGRKYKDHYQYHGDGHGKGGSSHDGHWGRKDKDHDHDHGDWHRGGGGGGRGGGGQDNMED